MATGNLLTLAPEVGAILNRPFPDGDVCFDAPRPDGFKPAYLAWDKIAARLDEAFGSAWSFEVITFQANGSQWIVQGRLSVQTQVGDQIILIHKDGIGTSDMEKLNGTPLDSGSALKAAASDALKRAATLFGVGIQLYRKETQERQVKSQANDTLATQLQGPAQPFQIESLKKLFTGYGYQDHRSLLASLNVQDYAQISSLVAAQLLSGQHPLIAWLNQNAPVKPAGQTGGMRASNA